MRFHFPLLIFLLLVSSAVKSSPTSRFVSYCSNNVTSASASASLSDVALAKSDASHFARYFCNDSPGESVEKVVVSEEQEYKEFRWRSANGKNPVLLAHLHSSYISDCNSTQAIVGHYEWEQDTLVLYKFWCHNGDPAGKQWGAYKARYKWVCHDDALVKIDAVVYLESLYEDGGAPLSTEEMKDKELVQQREDFKRHTARDENAEFVIGSEARSLLKEVKSKMKSIIAEVESAFTCDETGFGCRVWD